MGLRLDPWGPGLGKQNFKGTKILEAAKFKDQLKYKNGFGLVLLIVWTNFSKVFKIITKLLNKKFPKKDFFKQIIDIFLKLNCFYIYY